MRIVIVDDDFLVCRSLKTILEANQEVQVLAMGHNGKQAIALYKEHQPHVLLMDIRMDVMNGLDAATEILADFPMAKILFLTTFADDEYIIKALRLGAKGFILKQHFEGILPAIKTVYSGQSVFGDQVAMRIPEILAPATATTAPELGHYHLNDREVEVLQQVANGLSNKEIAEVLFLSEGTVRNYISALLEKLDLRDRTQLAIFYYKRGK